MGWTLLLCLDKRFLSISYVHLNTGLLQRKKWDGKGECYRTLEQTSGTNQGETSPSLGGHPHSVEETSGRKQIHDKGRPSCEADRLVAGFFTRRRLPVVLDKLWYCRNISNWWFHGNANSVIQLQRWPVRVVHICRRLLVSMGLLWRTTLVQI